MTGRDSLLDARESEATDIAAIRHIRSWTPDRTLCGASRDPSIPTKWGRPDCIVCLDVAGSMPNEARQALRAYWRRMG